MQFIISLSNYGALNDIHWQNKTYTVIHLVRNGGKWCYSATEHNTCAINFQVFRMVHINFHIILRLVTMKEAALGKLFLAMVERDAEYCKTHYYRSPFNFAHFALDDDNPYITGADIRSK